jgi:hypothetical protein
VSKTVHLMKRGSAWYYKRRVPKNLVQAIGKEIIQVSLETTSQKTALQRRAVRDLEWDAKFEAAEQALGSSAAKGASADGNLGTLNEPLAMRLLQDYVERTDNRSRREWAENPPENAEERREVMENIETELAIYRNRARDYDHEEAIARAWDHIRGSADFEFDEQTFSSAMLFDGVKRALIEVQRRAYLNIAATSDEDDDSARELKKSLKTKTSRRKVPIHPELVNIGFLRFVDDQKATSSDPLLFRGIPRNKYDDPAPYPLKRFREKYLPEAISLKPRQTRPLIASGTPGVTPRAGSVHQTTFSRRSAPGATARPPRRTFMVQNPILIFTPKMSARSPIMGWICPTFTPRRPVAISSDSVTMLGGSGSKRASSSGHRWRAPPFFPSHYSTP